jgi:fatty-acyl-CoA synthase
MGKIKDIEPSSTNLLCDDFEKVVDQYGPRPAMQFEGKVLTYAELDALSNRFAHWALDQGLVRGDCVALLMPNRAEYVAVWIGLSKVGVETALINNSLIGPALAHCLSISGAHQVIADAETIEAFEAVQADLPRSTKVWVLEGAKGDRHDLTQALKSCNPLRPDRASVRKGLTAGETMLYIYTSGTTGLPKAAKVTHARTQTYMRGFAGATDVNAKDRVYITLPLYHATGGFGAMGAALMNGATVVLRRRFSLTQFWNDVVEERCTVFVYIGELCRYLINQEPVEGERKHQLRLAVGNGLRGDVWEKMNQRFAIPKVLEFYGSTEGNVSMFNWDGKIGAIGRAPAYLKSTFNFKLVRFDVETEQPIRDARGRCIECGPGEVGECIGLIGTQVRTGFSGYADRAATEKKILTGAFKKDDRWFRTGDLMRRDEEDFYYFVDRIGETFRWKSENVSTAEVSQQLTGSDGVQEAIVYGVSVEGFDGRAGMASMVVGPEFDLVTFASHVEAQLPAFARPIFIRLTTEVETTGTFKYRKLDLVEQGFDPAKITQPLFFKKPGEGYVPITPELYDPINAGAFRI